ncbi:Uncharacterised protein [Raoultella ornithinolytica]|nr:Uncharacterised protein [Raoultella ornithinolytica]
MRNIRHQVATHLLVAFQGAGELVKILRQAAEFIATTDRHAGGEISRRQAVGPFDQTFDRCQQAARQREGCQRSKDRRQSNNQPAGALLLTVKVNIGIARQTLDR